MGIGTSEIGLTPFGFGDATEPTAAPNPTQWSRHIDTHGVYAIDAVSGNFRRMPVLKQRILLAVTTELGSSTVLRDFGFKRPRKMGTTFAAEVEAAVRKALRRLTDVERVMSITSIAVERDSTRALATIYYTDNTTGLAEEIAVTRRPT